MSRLGAMQWSELERYRQLLQEYEAQLAERERLTTAYREAQAAGSERAADAQRLKAKLDEQFPQLKEQYDQITALRSEIAEARDAAVAE
jgi:uncharacterized membrane protein